MPPAPFDDVNAASSRWREVRRPLGVLSDVKTGYPILLTEMTILTALRTAGTSAPIGKYLAPDGARVMAMIGNGAQSEFQCLAFKAICGIDTARLYDIDSRATEKAARNLRGKGLKVVPCASGEDAVEARRSSRHVPPTSNARPS